MQGDNLEDTYLSRKYKEALENSPSQWKLLYEQNYVLDERIIKLDELLTEQYNLVEDMTNSQSAKSWKEFCDTWESEYSLEEIKQGRKNLLRKGVRYE